jgi:hypothetical protein
MTATETEYRTRKERSPSFPFIPLKKAVERAQAMWTAHRKNPARVAAVGETWGYSAASSGLVQTIAALKSYGLIDDIGRGEDRRLQISDLASRLLLDSRPSAKENAIKEAAEKPKLIAEYLKLWLDQRPSQAHCISELTLDRGFNEDAAMLFMRIFDENISFANLKGDDKIQPISDEAQIEPTEDRRAAPPIRDRHVGPTGPTGPPPQAYSMMTAAGPLPPVDPTREQKAPVPAPFAPAATLPLPEGIVSLSIPQGLSSRSVKAMRAWIEVVIGLSTLEEG